jgi:hypothetical protein
VALRNIAAGEELNYDYGLMVEERYTPKLKAEYACYCGAALPGHHAGAQEGLAPADAGRPMRPAALRGDPGTVRRTASNKRKNHDDLTHSLERRSPVGSRGPRLPGFTVEVLPSMDSSNTELMRRARTGDTGPTLLVAEQQTAGRGRLGRPGPAAWAIR